ncbi:hypothetical protein [Mariniphaga sp.]|uniref:hypothetical protein n=1 Tax=Mariniphaga sp. TaxID=1954475 RepID=UPI00356A6116
MNNLIIHPRDSSTDFLKPIYAPLKNKTVITGGISKTELREVIKEHDRVIMLGHGSPGGLLTMQQFGTTNGFIIDYSMVDVLKEKKDNVFIWCNADQFVYDYDLEGFYSGMFISEIDEAIYYDFYDIEPSEIDESNYWFAEIVSRYINHPLNVLYDNLIQDYRELARTNPIAQFNLERLYISHETKKFDSLCNTKLF